MFEGRPAALAAERACVQLQIGGSGPDYRIKRTTKTGVVTAAAATLFEEPEPAILTDDDDGTVDDQPYNEDDGCFVPEGPEIISAEDISSKIIDRSLLIAPIVLPILAAIAFEWEVNVVHEAVELLSQARWVQVDGGLSRAAALLPVMTGIVLPCVSFALGTLTATTISTLRARQVQLRTELNTEACLIRSLLSALESMFPRECCVAERTQAALLLREYCSRVLTESRSGIDLDKLAKQGAANSELDGITRLLHHAPPLPPPGSHRIGDAVVVVPPTPRFRESTEFLAQMYLEKLQLVRSERLAVLQTTFPSVHWLALSLLGVSIAFSFLLAADQQTLLFLAPVQLRLLFAVLVGALTATACICVDLNDPFRGAFQITPSSEQLILIREIVEQELLCTEE